jgi:hypothetical protein
VHPVPPIAAGAAAAHASWGTTQVGAQPYVNPEHTKAVFNRDLLSKGVLPVLLVVDNSGSSSEIELVRSGIALSKPSGGQLAPLAPEASVNGEERNAMAEGVLLLGPFSYDNARNYNDAMRRDWTEKALPDVAVVLPGQTLRKFLYFDVGKNFNTTGATLLVPARVGNAAERQTVGLKF